MTAGVASEVELALPPGKFLDMVLGFALGVELVLSRGQSAGHRSGSCTMSGAEREKQLFVPILVVCSSPTVVDRSVLCLSCHFICFR